jgi:tight adherence protein B
MRALRRALIVGVGAAACATAAQAAKAPGFRLTPLASVQFPDRAFVIATNKGTTLTRGSVRVSEDGKPVNRLSVVPASRTSERTFGVILVVDASNSMRGKAIRGAVAAARAFAARSASTEAIGLMTFNRTILVVAQPTTDEKRIASSLRTLPRLQEGTRLWDAVDRAVDVLRKDKITAGSIVVLTDGRDTGSKLTPRQLVTKARAAGVRIFAVGLRSRQFRPGPLAQVARGTHAAYAEATSTANLAAIYSSLSAKLAREYLLRYRSLAGPGKKVTVRVAVAGLAGAANWRYETPGLPGSSVPPFHRSFLDRFVSSPASVALLALLAAVLAWLGVSSILKLGRSTVRYRVAEFVSLGVGTPTGTDAASLRVRERLLSHVLLTAERAFQRTPWWERFKEELEIAEFPAGPAQLAAGTAAASIVLALFGFVVPVLALMALAPPLFVRALYKEKLRKRRLAFEEQLPDNLTVLAASLRAGHSFVGGLSSVLDQAEEPSRSELRRAVADEQLGVPVEDALLNVAQRMASADLEQVALVASLQRQTGGNTAEVLDAVVESIRERFNLRRLVRTLTAQGRLARWILTALPLVTAGWIGLINPHYLSPLFHTSFGQVLLVMAALMVVGGSFAVKQITEIEI